MTTALQAVMMLRSLHQDDRNWILSKLSQSEQEAIRNVSNEINTTLPVSSQSFELAIAREERDVLSQSAIASRLNKLEPIQISSALESEPDWFITLVLSAHHWSWHRAVLEQLCTERKAYIERATATHIPHRLVESMLYSLYVRANAVTDFVIPTNSAPLARSRWTVFQSKLKGFVSWAY